MAFGGWRVGCLHHDAHQRLGAARANEHAAVLAQRGLCRVYRLGNRLIACERMLVGHPHVDERLREALHDRSRLGNRCARTSTGRQELQCRYQTVARGVVLEEDHVAALLAAKHVAILAHGLEHVAVAHLRLNQVNARIAQGMRKAEVAHDRGHACIAGQQAALLEVDGAHGLYHVAVDFVSLRIHQHDAVGIAVVGYPHVCPDFGHQIPQRLQVGRPAGDVDVGAVEVLVDHRHVCSQTAQRLGAGHARSAVSHVKGHLDT